MLPQELQVFLPPFSHTLLLYLCFPSQMVLLGFYHDSSLFTSTVTSIHTGAHNDRHCVCERERERERVHMVRVPERIRTLWGCLVSNPSCLCGRRVLSPLCYAPWAKASEHSYTCFGTGFVTGLREDAGAQARRLQRGRASGRDSDRGRRR